MAASSRTALHARPRPGGAVLQLGLIGFGVGHEVGERIRREILARDEHPRRIGKQRDVFEVGHRVVERLFVERLVDGENGAAREQDRVTVGRCLGGAARPGHAARAGDVFDHDLLAEDFAQSRRENPPQRIDRPARRVGHDHGDRPVRPVLRARRSELRQHKRDRANRLQHVFLPRVRNTSSAVIAGLDPAIHPLRKKFLRRMMDPRVKPAGDACGCELQKSKPTGICPSGEFNPR